MIDMWQPIATAPMDGTYVDLWCKRSWNPPQTHERSTDMYWCRIHKCWRKRGNEHVVDTFWKPSPDRHLIPTHWMPVFLPPSDKP